MLNKNNFVIAKLCAKEVGNTLNTIRVTPTETAVTDGHLLVVVKGDEQETEDFPKVSGIQPETDFIPFTLDKEVALSVAKSVKKSKMPILQNIMIGTNENGKYMVTTNLEQTNIVPVKDNSGSFPDYSKVIPSEESTKFSIKFDLNKLVPLLSTLKDISNTYSDGKWAKFSFTDNEKALRIDLKTEEEQEVIAVIMPGKL